MNANLASIMPQALAVWCEQEGHEVTFVCYTGFENLLDELPKDVDLVFIGAFTEAAQLAYALSALLRSRGAVTVLGGPHARCYPQDAAEVLRLRARLHRPRGRSRSRPRATRARTAPWAST